MNGTIPEDTNHDEIQGSGLLSHIDTKWMLVVSIGLALVLYMMVGLISSALINNYYGVGSAEMMREMDGFLADHGNDLNLYRLMQILSTVLIFGFSAIISSYLFMGSLFGFFSFSKESNLKSIYFVPLIMLLVFPVITLVYSYTSKIPVPDELAFLEENLEKFTIALLGDPSWKIFALNFLMIAILPAICEELLFRGVLQKLFIKSSGSAHVGILITGLLFGLIHGQVFKFLPIAVLGILLGYLYWWTRNLWFPIIAHFFHNGIQVVLYFLLSKGWIDMDIESAEMIPPWQSLVFAVLFAGVMYLFYNANRKTANEPI